LSIQLIANEIRRFLSTKDPEVICIRGRWGVGKTFAWNRYLQAARADGMVALKRYSYVSLFGLTSLDDLKFAIFENAVPADNDAEPSQFAHSVMIANVQASLETTRHLIALGHRRVAYLGDRYGYQSDAERYQGYRQALEEGGLTFEPLLVAHGDGKPEGAEAAIMELLALPLPPTAVFCYNDMSALGAMRQIRNHGLRIPTDISVVGFDDLYISQYLNPPLTTVRQPMRQMGRLAMETLLQIFAGAESGHDIKVPGELIVRQSTASPKENS
jgi:DNA-binding LacI/PurR family transcriptional regulator